MNEWSFKCEVCGKFISYLELEKVDIEVTYIPDSPFTEEYLAYTCTKCIRKEREK